MYINSQNNINMSPHKRKKKIAEQTSTDSIIGELKDVRRNNPNPATNNHTACEMHYCMSHGVYTNPSYTARLGTSDISVSQAAAGWKLSEEDLTWDSLLGIQTNDVTKYTSNKDVRDRVILESYKSIRKSFSLFLTDGKTHKLFDRPDHYEIVSDKAVRVHGSKNINAEELSLILGINCTRGKVIGHCRDNRYNVTNKYTYIMEYEFAINGKTFKVSFGHPVASPNNSHYDQYVINNTDVKLWYDTNKR